MRRSNYTQIKIHTESLKKKDMKAVIFSLLCIASRLWKVKFVKTSRRVSGNALGLGWGTAIKKIISLLGVSTGLKKHNTAFPSSAVVQRLFSVGTDVMKPKRSRLSDEHFVMIVFLKYLKV